MAINLNASSTCIIILLGDKDIFHDKKYQLKLILIFSISTGMVIWGAQENQILKWHENGLRLFTSGNIIEIAVARLRQISALNGACNIFYGCDFDGF